MPRALVTGGAGFLGSNLCESLIDDGYAVTCVDNLGSGRRENVSHLDDNPDFEFFEADVRDPLPDTPPVDEIYHLASRASPIDFAEFPMEIALTNSVGTYHMLEYARREDASVMLASTSEVYGDPEEHPQSESYHGNVDIRGVRAIYDESKRLAETMGVVYQRQHGLDVRAARIFNTYGPRMRPDDGRAVPNFITQALQGEDLTIFGDGEQTRCFCYVDDLIRGFRRLMDADDASGEAVNLGTRNEITILQLAESVLELTDTGSELVFEPLPENDPQRRKPRLGKARELLDWEPEIELETGLRRTLEHFENDVR